MDPLQRHRLQVSKTQAYEEIPAAGQRRGLTRPKWGGGRQDQLGHTVEGHMGKKAEKIPTTRKERKVQESLEGPRGRTQSYVEE